MRYRRTPALILTLLVIIIALVLWAAVDDANSANRTQIRHTICTVFGPRCDSAVRVALCESRLDPLARGRAGERGLLQISPVHFGRVLRSRYGGSIYVQASRLYEPLFNSRVAYVLSDGGRNWRHWTCKP